MGVQAWEGGGDEERDEMRYNRGVIWVAREGRYASIMRLTKTAAGVKVFSMLPWEREELAALAVQGREWVPFSSTGKQQRVLGQIHSQSREIALEKGVEIYDRQVVVLGPVERSTR
ncbi:hypothetical protein Krac_12391 [Ktedonobacter racemifer DSM 44963]|uniref:Uncharacterized protein n=2 Tax=Ktedonobacter racemifer TaxID=363277 RepID=D6TGP5_KTERA|nr:hypothetical protein Krac_12391 [Ktedonobacter racemifer DSM 44963]